MKSKVESLDSSMDLDPFSKSICFMINNSLNVEEISPKTEVSEHNDTLYDKEDKEYF